MTPHIDEPTLRAFALGEVGEHVAIVVAEHLDACPQCRARAEALDPVVAMLDEVSEPAVPAHLIAAILEADRATLAPTPADPWRESIIGAGLVMLAAALALLPADVLTVLRPVHTVVTSAGLGLRHVLGDALLLQALMSVVLSGTAVAGAIWAMQRRERLGGGW